MNNRRTNDANMITAFTAHDVVSHILANL